MGKVSEYRNKYRIIGGDWRGRRLAFPSIDGLRPSPDRVRETLFNWLQPHVQAANCLDLFAGSGALGFEALSRGAAQATFVDSQQGCIDAIKANLVRVDGLTKGSAIHMDALTYLAQAPDQFDIVFLDPPYRSGLLQAVLSALENSLLLHAGSKIYLESAGRQAPALPAGWTMRRSKRAGNVGYHLAEVDA